MIAFISALSLAACAENTLGDDHPALSETMTEAPTPEITATSTPTPTPIPENWFEVSEFHRINPSVHEVGNGTSMIEVYPYNAEDEEVIKNVEGWAISVTVKKGAYNLHGNTELMEALYKNAENLCIKFSYKKQKKTGGFIIDTYECFDINTKESLGTLTIKELNQIADKKN